MLFIREILNKLLGGINSITNRNDIQSNKNMQTNKIEYFY